VAVETLVGRFNPSALFLDDNGNDADHIKGSPAYLDTLYYRGLPSTHPIYIKLSKTPPFPGLPDVFKITFSDIKCGSLINCNGIAIVDDKGVVKQGVLSISDINPWKSMKMDYIRRLLLLLQLTIFGSKTKPKHLTCSIG
jgi:hypothetical protein